MRSAMRAQAPNWRTFASLTFAAVVSTCAMGLMASAAQGALIIGGHYSADGGEINKPVFTDLPVGIQIDEAAGSTATLRSYDDKCTISDQGKRAVCPIPITKLLVGLGDRDDVANLKTASLRETEIYGNTGNDTIWGSPKNDEIYGDSGNDLISGRAGSDLLSGGLGDDTLTYAVYQYYGVTVSVGNGEWDDGNNADRDPVFFTGRKDTVWADFETVAGTHLNDTLIQHPSLSTPRTLKGLRGDDILLGGDGVDILIGGEGNDNLQGKGGDDIVGGGLLVEESGNDLAIGGPGNDILVPGLDDDIAIGGTGNDISWDGPGGGVDLFLDGVGTWFPAGGQDSFITLDGNAESIDCGTNDNESDGDPNDNGPEGTLSADPFDTLTNC